MDKPHNDPVLDVLTQILLEQRSLLNLVIQGQQAQTDLLARILVDERAELDDLDKIANELLPPSSDILESIHILYGAT